MLVCHSVRIRSPPTGGSHAGWCVWWCSWSQRCVPTPSLSLCAPLFRPLFSCMCKLPRLVLPHYFVLFALVFGIRTAATKISAELACRPLCFSAADTMGGRSPPRPDGVEKPSVALLKELQSVRLQLERAANTMERQALRITASNQKVTQVCQEYWLKCLAS